MAMVLRLCFVRAYPGRHAGAGCAEGQAGREPLLHHGAHAGTQEGALCRSGTLALLKKEKIRKTQKYSFSKCLLYVFLCRSVC